MNIQLFNELGIKKIITFCPHCFNTLKYEYPQFKGNYEVLHSTELLNQLIKTGKINLNKNDRQKITFHDSCYLGRYSKIYQQPREVIKSITSNLIELGRNKDRSFCCGAGGGRMWLEETIGERINNMRTDEVIKSGAEKVVSSCPYCLTMMTDGLKNREAMDKVAAMDIIELVEQAMR
jgi:Fe-S oxidoreductase